MHHPLKLKVTGKVTELELSVEPQVALYTTLTLLGIMTSLSTMFQLGKNAVISFTLSSLSTNKTTFKNNTKDWALIQIMALVLKKALHSIALS